MTIIYGFRKHLLSLSSITRDQYKTFKSHDLSNCKTTNYEDIRRQMSEFFLFLRDSIKRYVFKFFFEIYNTPEFYLF